MHNDLRLLLVDDWLLVHHRLLVDGWLLVHGRLDDWRWRCSGWRVERCLENEGAARCEPHWHLHSQDLARRRRYSHGLTAIDAVRYRCAKLLRPRRRRCCGLLNGHAQHGLWGSFWGGDDVLGLVLGLEVLGGLERLLDSFARVKAPVVRTLADGHRFLLYHHLSRLHPLGKHRLALGLSLIVAYLALLHRVEPVLHHPAGAVLVLSGERLFVRCEQLVTLRQRRVQHQQTTVVLCLVNLALTLRLLELALPLAHLCLVERAVG
mmetsp:Transcript_18138/g.30302  ORF Transcript_18138/g.30302 Transcript_18138/m.30302 type:complete len:264 (-) Transcript_18138:2418-3209(-)